MPKNKNKTITLIVNCALDRQIRIESAKSDICRSEFIRRILVEKIKRLQRSKEEEGENEFIK